MYKWILLAHAIGGATLFGAHVYMEALMASAGRVDDRAKYMTTMLQATNSAGRVLGPASLITLVFGIWLVIDTAYDWEEIFVSIGLVVVVAAFAISVFLLSPRLREVEAVVEENGIGDDTAFAKMRGIGNLVHVLTLLVAVAFVVMIIKPGIL
jgi:uncharacterized membrane protein